MKTSDAFWAGKKPKNLLTFSDRSSWTWKRLELRSQMSSLVVVIVVVVVVFIFLEDRT